MPSSLNVSCVREACSWASWFCRFLSHHKGKIVEVHLKIHGEHSNQPSLFLEFLKDAFPFSLKSLLLLFWQCCAMSGWICIFFLQQKVNAMYYLAKFRNLKFSTCKWYSRPTSPFLTHCQYLKKKTFLPSLCLGNFLRRC